jgi:hypothetical protein
LLVFSTFIYQDRDDDVEARQQTLNAVLRNGQTMLKQDVSPEDKDNIKKDLENLQARFSKVGCLTLISWGAIQGLFHQSLVAIGPVVSEEKIKM